MGVHAISGNWIVASLRIYSSEVMTSTTASRYSRLGGLRPLMIGLLTLSLAACSGSRVTQTEPPPQEAVDPNVLAVVDGEPITVSEFKEHYQTSPAHGRAPSADSFDSHHEFLEQYVDFRLKVRAAQDAGYGERTDLQEEVANYRRRLARPHFLNKTVYDPLARELYERSQELVDVSHILLRLPEGATPEDTLAAYRRMEAIVDSLDQGADFGEMAVRYSDDPSVQQGPGQVGHRGRIGFVQPGRMVKSFEDVAYETPVGERSPVFRSPYGYHVLQVNERAPAVPDIRVSHIMIRPRSGQPSDTVVAYRQLEALKDSLQAGAAFADLARQYSDDSQTADLGGDLKGHLQTDYLSYAFPFIREFKDAAFELEEVGEVSDVVRTRFGYHLIKLTDKRALPRSYTAARDSLVSHVRDLPRSEEAKAQLAARVRAEYGATIDTTLLRSIVSEAPVGQFWEYVTNGEYYSARSDDVVASVGDSTITLGQLSRHLRRQRFSQDAELPSLLSALNTLVDDQAISYASLRKVRNDPTFQEKVDTFREGIQLYALMEDSVWTEAARDTARLRQHFEKHESSYRYPDRVRTVSFVSSSDTLLQNVKEQLDAGEPADQVIPAMRDEYDRRLQIDTVTVSQRNDGPYDLALDLGEGATSELVPLEERYGFRLLYAAEHLPARQKTFEEALPQVISDYRDVLDEQLRNRLREVYETRLYPEHLRNALPTLGEDHNVQTAASH